jgi:hypothetical protein
VPVFFIHLSPTMNAKITAFLLFIAGSSFAQEVNIKGKWKVNCVIERKDQATLHTCDICPTTILANNTAVVEEFELEFLANTIKVPTEEITIELPYEYNRENNEVKFHYKGKDYAFRCMIVSDPNVQILMADSGEVLYLKRIPK